MLSCMFKKRESLARGKRNLAPGVTHSQTKMMSSLDLVDN